MSSADAVMVTRLRLESLNYGHHYLCPPTLELNFEHGVTIRVEGNYAWRDLDNVQAGREYAISVRLKPVDS